jgi:two-component system NarL family response regulator
MVAEGKTYKEVADIIGLKERTIKYHMGKMLEYLHLENRSQVIAYAGRNQMIDQ